MFKKSGINSTDLFTQSRLPKLSNAEIMFLILLSKIMIFDIDFQLFSFIEHPFGLTYCVLCI
jgi:hypothetical protein